MPEKVTWVFFGYMQHRAANHLLTCLLRHIIKDCCLRKAYNKTLETLQNHNPKQCYATSSLFNFLSSKTRCMQRLSSISHNKIINSLVWLSAIICSHVSSVNVMFFFLLLLLFFTGGAGLCSLLSMITAHNGKSGFHVPSICNRKWGKTDWLQLEHQSAFNLSMSPGNITVTERTKISMSLQVK